jgi:hypothetical protein
MSDYLSAVLQRATGAVPVVQPLIPPVFAPIAEKQVEWSELLVEQETAGPAAARTHMPPPQRHAPEPDDVVPDPALVVTVASEEQLDADTNKPAGPRFDTHEPPPLVTSPDDRRDEATSASVHARSADPVSETVGAAPQRSLAIVRIARGVVRRSSPAPPFETFPQPLQTGGEPLETADSEPRSVHVHIGRIDIRAAFPPGPQTKEPARPASSPPHLTLDEYLRRRNRGAS